jgi:hypothetical protein
MEFENQLTAANLTVQDLKNRMAVGITDKSYNKSINGLIDCYYQTKIELGASHDEAILYTLDKLASAL